MPQPKANGMSEPVVHGGRWKRFMDHIHAASIHCILGEYRRGETYSFCLTWNTEFPSFSKQIHKAVLNKRISDAQLPIMRTDFIGNAYESMSDLYT